MRIIESLKEMTETARGWLAGGTVGLVLVKGELHEGHMTLIREMQKACEISVVGLLGCCWPLATDEERETYKRNRESKTQLLSLYQNLVVFIPRFEEMYPNNFRTLIVSSGFPLESLNEQQRENGRSSLTLIIKLFHLVRPDVVYWGQKNPRQITILRQMIRDLNIDVRLRMMPTIRESDGLALSVRNANLSEAERQAAVLLYPTLLAGRALILGGERCSTVIEQEMIHLLQGNALISLDFAGIYSPDLFLPTIDVVPGILLTIAVSIGSTQLLDTITWMENGQWRT